MKKKKKETRKNEREKRGKFIFLARCGSIGIVEDAPQEEGQPAEYEGAHDDAQRPGSLVLSLHLHDILILGRRVQVIGTDLVQRQRLGGARAVQLPVQIIQILARPVAQQHHVPHPAVHLLLLPVRLFKHGEIRERHDGARYPERDARREYHVNLVHLKLA